MSVEYDFYISKFNRFIVPEYDINLLFSVQESSIPSIAEASETTVKIAGKDGDIVLATNYEPLNFELILYSDENLTPEEKSNEINKVTSFLNSIKKKTKMFAILEDEKMIPVKYNNQLTIVRYPKSIRFEIPLKSSHSYYRELEKESMVGQNTAISNTIEPVGCEITVEGPTTGVSVANAMTIELNGIQMKYSNTILAGNKLIINTEKSTVTHVTSTGVKTNASIYFNHQYPKIHKGTNEMKIYNGISDNTQVKTEWHDLKL